MQRCRQPLKVPRLLQSTCIGLGPVEARCGRLLALRPRLDQADYLGSNIHVSCGREVVDWEITEEEDGSQRLRFRLCVGRRVADPKVWLFLPGCREPPYGAAEAKEVASEVWCIPLPMIPKQGAAFSLSWPCSRNSATTIELSLIA
ncbi:aglC [Symbiodinium sp. CCMP2456]|nr:aglC [Symbiodinium sp. CCMP2456]